MLNVSLHPSETLLAEITPSKRVMLYWLAWRGGIVMLYAALFIFSSIKQQIGYFMSTDMAAILGVFILIGVFISYLKFKKTNYVITNQRLIVNTGIIGSSSRNITYKQISDIQYRQTFIEKGLNIASVIITEVGATRYSGMSTFAGLSPDESHKAVTLITKYMIDAGSR